MLTVFLGTASAGNLSINAQHEGQGIKLRNSSAWTDSPEENCWSGKPFLFDVSSEEFLDTDKNVADIEIEFYSVPGDTLEVKGVVAGEKSVILSKKISKKSKPGWQTSVFEAADLQFPSEKGALPHFTVYSAKPSLKVRSFTVRPYSRTKNVNWKRMIQCERVEPGRLVFAYFRGDLTYPLFILQNRAAVDFPAHCELRLKDWEGNTIWQKTAEGKIPAGGRSIKAPFPKTFPFGIYQLELTVKSAKNNEELFTESTRIALHSPNKVRKADPGEYLYGVDPKLTRLYTDEEILA